MTIRNHYIAALDEMTGLLLENKVSGGRELFLTLFISLAAMEAQVQVGEDGKHQGPHSPAPADQSYPRSRARPCVL